MAQGRRRRSRFHSELENAAGAEDPARLAGMQPVADLAFTAAGAGIGVARSIERKAAHQAALHHLEAVVALIALAQGTAQLRQGDRRQRQPVVDRIPDQLAIAATTAALHVDVDLRVAVAIQIGDLCPHHRTVNDLVNGGDGSAGTRRRDRQLLLRSFTATGDRKANALQRERALEPSSTPGVSREELQVSVEKSLLTVAYNRSEDSDSLTESFKRSWRLGPELDGEKVSATYTNGILSLSVPRRETPQVQARRVEIN